MKKKSLLIMLLVALFVPLAMNAQNVKLKKSPNGSVKPKLEVNAPAKAMPSNPMLSKLESAKEAALEELNGRGVRANNELLTQGFESMSSISTSYSATGWYAYNAGMGNNWTLNSTSTYANNGSKSAQVQYSSRYAANCYLVSAPFTVSSSMSELTVSLYERVRSESYDETFEVFFVKASDVSNLAGVASATKYNAIASASYTNTTYAQQSGTVTNSALAGQSVRVVVHCTSEADKYYLYIDDITVTEKTVVEGCSAPEDFAATNVTSNSVTLSWTETGTSEEWAILYMCEEDTEAQIEYADTNPYTLTGLNPATYYIAEVIPMCGDYDQESDVIEFTTEDLPCPKPTNLSASNITMNSATVSWTGEADSYTLQYRIPASDGEPVLFQGFESGSLDDWTAIRNGGGTEYTDWRVINPGGSPAHSGSYVAMSRSWASSAYNVDNWLISPQFKLGGTLKYWVMDDGQYHETYYICVSTGGNTVRDFTQIHAPGNATGDWTEVTVDLSAYEGMNGYIAFHHTDNDQDYLFIDDIGVYGESQPAGPWVTINNATSPYTITGLQGETTYEWQVQGDCGTDGTSLWTSGENFTTASPCDAPVSLTATNVTNSSATISWAGNTDTYNIQYGAVDPNAPVTVILTADDVWGDDSGYQMLLDADATAYGTTIPETGALTTSGDASAAVYAEFEYKIPVRADGALTTTNIVSNGASVSIEIPAGTYDWCITNPTPGDRMWIASAQGNVGGRQDDYVFEPGKTYEFHVYLSGENDATDVTITNNAEMTVVNNVTSPYTLSNLDMDTQYEVQVQGVNCDGNGSTTNWSAGVSFTTLNGILVERISADDVTVIIDETATIANLVVLPADATNPAVTYTSNDETIATVDENGVVTGVAVGETTITIAATDGSGVTTDITVTVAGIDVTEITAEDVTLATSETATITYTVAPNNATDASVTFTSANTNIATVDANGVVTGVAVGETTITIASVSNPEVTAEINVTVTSNPNAVQFTVNVPATAQPGDVITVEAYMAAPTSGNYDGFTSLGVHLYYDNTVFQHTADPTYGAVGNACMLKQFSYPSDGVVRVAFVQPAGSPTTVTGLLFSMEFTVLAEAELGSSYTFQVEPMDAANFTCNYNNGQPATQIPYEFTPSTVVVAALETYIKHIDAYTTDKGGYYLIASPIGTVNIEEVGNMLDNQYDLYYFDQNQDLEWINYKQGGEFTSLNAGQGYLYANSEDTDLTFTGTAYSGNGEVRLTKDASNNPTGGFEGWNLVGNPFATTAYISGNRDFYVMNSAGDEITVADRQAIETMEGVFVIAETDGEIITFTTEAPFKVAKTVINVTKDSRVIDRAIIRFGQGNTTPKIQINERSTKVYIPQENKDCAVVYADDLGEMPVNFKAATNGTYHLHINSQEVSYSYLHLIDNLTGADVDLLVNPSYSFEATTSDYSSRFKLVFSTTTSVNDNNFGFISNGNLKIFGLDGQATLKVMDITGRTLSTETFSGSYDKQLNLSAGVYMIQLIQGDNVKTQKVVVK